MGAVKRNFWDHSQGDQECGTVQQVTPSADLISAAKKSQNQIEAAAATGRVYPSCRKAAKSGPQKQKMLQEGRLAQLARHPERKLLRMLLLLLGEGHAV